MEKQIDQFKVLLIYPNGLLMNPPPISYGIFTALLKEKGYSVELFDTTLYRNHQTEGSDEMKESTLQVRPFSYESRDVQYKETDPTEDLITKINNFKPDLICISVLETIYEEVLPIIKTLNRFNIPVLAGCVFATYAPEVVLSHKCVTMACIGEGENVLMEVCDRLAHNKEWYDIKGLAYIKDGKLIKNSQGIKKNIDSLPIPDFSLFEYSRFLRPMGGQVYVTIPMETNRGCPYTCAFCNSPSNTELYKETNQTFFRKKSICTIEKELKHLIKQNNAEFVYFCSDTFMIFTKKEWNEFVEMYKGIHLPFWIQTRAETLTVNPDRVKTLREIGCHRVSLGLEHGNAEYRQKVILKGFDNQMMIDATQLLYDNGIPTYINNIIGFPGETRGLIFDTIELNRKLKGIDTTNCSVFAPFFGTPLRKVCIDKGYIKDNFISGTLNTTVHLKNMSNLSSDELDGLRKTFAMYARMPKKYWGKLKKAERNDKQGNLLFAELAEIYTEKYFGSGTAEMD